MTSKSGKVVLVGAILLGMVATEAGAWGPEAQTAIANVALQRIQRKYPVILQKERDAKFEKGDQTHYNDLIKGAVDACHPLDSNLGIKGRQDAFEMLTKHVVLLREMRQYGIGSYFAYRMGILSAVASDILFPFGLDRSPEGTALREKLEKDVEAHVNSLPLLPTGELSLVGNAERYFNGLTPFNNSSLVMIEGDYNGGAGYNGYMKQGTAAFFDHSVRATSDIWYTVLSTREFPGGDKPSAEVMTWYVVNEIQYLLSVKKNPAEALKKYGVLEKVNPGIAEAYEKLGDFLDAYATENNDQQVRERALKEWQRALELPTADRRRISAKMANYYIQVGRTTMAAAEKPGGYKQLPDAIAAFAKALEFENDNADAKAMHSQAQKRKREIDQELEAQSRKIDTAEQVKKRAEESLAIKDYTNAIIVFNDAYTSFDGVSDQFPELKDSANKQKEAIRNAISNIKNDVLTEADDTIARGDEAVQAKNFDEAMNQYQSVETIVKIISDGPETDFGKRRDEKIASAKQKVTEAENAKSRWEAEQEALKNNPQGGGAPAAR